MWYNTTAYITLSYIHESMHGHRPIIYITKIAKYSNRAITYKDLGRGEDELINAISYIANNFFNFSSGNPIAMPFLALGLITHSYCYARQEVHAW